MNYLVAIIVGVFIGLVIFRLQRMYQRRVERKAAVRRALGEVRR